MVSDAFGRLESFWQAVGGSFLGGWLVVENASKLSFSKGIQSVRLTSNVRGIGARLEMLLGGWKAFGRLLVEAFWEAG